MYLGANEDNPGFYHRWAGQAGYHLPSCAKHSVCQIHLRDGCCSHQRAHLDSTCDYPLRWPMLGLECAMYRPRNEAEFSDPKIGHAITINSGSRTLKRSTGLEGTISSPHQAWWRSFEGTLRHSYQPLYSGSEHCPPRARSNHDSVYTTWAIIRPSILEICTTYDFIHV